VVSTVLVHVTGRDRPGITARLMDLLAAHGAEVFDAEQVVLHGRLDLGLVVGAADAPTLRAALGAFGSGEGLTVEVDPVAEAPPPRRSSLVVTVMAPRVSPQAFAAVARAVADGGGNIDRIVRLSRYPVVCFELAVSGGRLEEVRRALGQAAADHRVDVAVQPEGLFRRAKRLVVLDVDSTLIQDEIIDLLAEEAGAAAEVAAVTAEAMEGSIDFEESLRRRVRSLAGLDASALDRVAARMRLSPGARTFVRTLKRLGMRVGIVSGGFTAITDRLVADLGLDHVRANTLEIADGRLTGEVVGPVVDRAGKAAALREIAALEGVPLAQTVAIGDGANDLDMLSTAGLGIAFNAKPVVAEAADTAVSVPYLDAVLFLLGIRRDDIEAADLLEGTGSERVPVEGLPPV